MFRQHQYSLSFFFFTVNVIIKKSEINEYGFQFLRYFLITLLRPREQFINKGLLIIPMISLE